MKRKHVETAHWCARARLLDQDFERPHGKFDCRTLTEHETRAAMHPDRRVRAATAARNDADAMAQIFGTDDPGSRVTRTEVDRHQVFPNYKKGGHL